MFKFFKHKLEIIVSKDRFNKSIKIRSCSYMKSIFASFILLTLLFPKTGLCQNYLTQKTDYNALAIFIELEEKYSLADEIPFKILLTSNIKQTINTFDTSSIEYIVEKTSSDNKTRKPHAHYLFDNTSLFVKTTPSGKQLIERIKNKNKKININSGQVLTLNLDMLNLFKRYFEQGKYVLTVIYEDQLKAEAMFEIVLDSKRSVPLLIDIIEKQNSNRKTWAVNTLSIVSGKATLKMKSLNDAESLRKECDKWRFWWNKRKAFAIKKDGKIVFTNKNE